MSQGSSVDSDEKLLYLLSLSSSNSRVFGRKKLMKLAFFAEHYDPSEGELVSEQQLGSFDFEIFKYGPFSKQVLDDFDKLRHQGDLSEDSSRMKHVIEIEDDGLERTREIEQQLSEEDLEHLRMVAQELSDMTGAELENWSLDLLGIEKRNKDQYRGMSVSSIIDGQTPATS